MVRWILKAFTSIKTSILLLGILCIFFLLGTIFPQGGDLEEYIRAGGRYLGFVRTFNILNIFSSPLFLFLSLLFFLNLICCTVSAANRIYKQGIGYDSLFSLGFHICLILCFAGFWLTYLYSFEGEITVFEGERKVVEGVGGSHGRIEIELLSLKTEYYQKPHLKYPKDKIERWKTAFGIGGRGPRFELRDDNLQPRDWKARVILYRDGVKIREKELEVNDPLRLGGFVFYLMGIEQRISIREDKGGGEFTVLPEEPFNLKNETFKVSPLRTGRLFKRDGSVEEIKPYMILFRAGINRTEDEGPVMLHLGERVTLGEVSITPLRVIEGVTLSYRWDPGVPVLFSGSFLFLILLSGRVIKRLVAPQDF